MAILYGPDTFTRADESPLGSPFASSATFGDLRLASNQVGTVSPDTDSDAYHGSITPAGDHWAEVKITALGTSNSDGGPAVNKSTSGNCYFCTNFSGAIHLFRIDTGGVFNELLGGGAPFTGNYALNDVIYIERTGTGASTVIKVKQNGVQRISFADSGGAALAAGTGTFGMHAFDGGLRFDNFTGGDFSSSSDTPLAVTEAALTLSGQSVSLFAEGIAVGDAALTLSGQDVQLLANANFVLAVTEALVTATGQDLPFQIDAPWTEATLSLTGQDVTLTAGLPIVLAVTEGAITLVGQDVVLALDVDYILTVTEGTVALTGQDVSFQLAGNTVLVVDSNNLVINGQDIGISPTITLSASTQPPRRNRFRGIIRLLNNRR